MTFTLNKSKFVVNEIIEGKFEITGSGLLENFESPTLYQHDSLEQFDTRSEIIEGNPTKKIFDYTLIPRSALSLSERPFTLSFFDPEKEIYYEKSFNLPELLVSGEAQRTNNQETHSDEEILESPQATSIPPNELTLLGPMGWDESLLIFKNIKTINIFLSCIIVILLLISIDFKRSTINRKKIIQGKIKKIMREGITYRNLYDLLSTYYRRELSAKEIIRRCDLSNEGKKYFLDVLESIGRHEFAKKKENQVASINYKYFKEFLR